MNLPKRKPNRHCRKRRFRDHKENLDFLDAGWEPRRYPHKTVMQRLDGVVADINTRYAARIGAEQRHDFDSIVNEFTDVMDRCKVGLRLLRDIHGKHQHTPIPQAPVSDNLCASCGISEALSIGLCRQCILIYGDSDAA